MVEPTYGELFDAFKRNIKKVKDLPNKVGENFHQMLLDTDDIMYGFNVSGSANNVIYGPAVPQDHKLAYANGRVKMVARTGHELATEEGKFPKQSKVAGNVDNVPYTRSQIDKKQVNKTHTTKNKDTVRRNKGNRPKMKRAFDNTKKSISDVFRGKRGRLLQASAFATTFMVGSRILSYGFNQVNRATSNPFDVDNRSAYLPAHYKEGYRDIKQHLTDFSSRVNLDKTVRRVIGKAPSSTRYGMVTTTQSVMNGNIALNLANNAINHTRY